MSEGDAPSPRTRRPWYLWASVGALAILVVVVVAAVVRPRPQDDYDDAVRDRFLAACTAQGGEPVRDTCVCLYDRMVESVPFDRFELLDQVLATQGDVSPDGPLDLPDDVQAMLDECVAENA